MKGSQVKRLESMLEKKRVQVWEEAKRNCQKNKVEVDLFLAVDLGQ
jgi:hypothetical protein